MIGSIVYFVFLIAVMIGILSLVVLLTRILIEGVPWLSWGFLTNYPSRHPEIAGIRSAMMGTIWVMALTALFTVPIGVGAAIYLEEYAPKNWLTNLIEINISNLAGVPSIVYGLLGWALFVQLWPMIKYDSERLDGLLSWGPFVVELGMGRVVMAGALTLSLLVLPIVILASREAIRAVPNEYRLGAYALGADQWQMIKGAVLPSAIPGILTGTILALSRAIGEAAPVIAISALVYLTFVPTDPFDQFTVMPIQIYNWVGRPQEDFQSLAAAGIIILLGILLTMNAVAVILRNKYQIRSEE